MPFLGVLLSMFPNLGLKKPFFLPHESSLPPTLQGSSFSTALQAGGYQPSTVYGAPVSVLPTSQSVSG